MDIDGLRAELEAARGKPKCPVCGKAAGWDIKTPEDADTILVVVQHGEFHPMHIRVLPILCRNCGFIRLHSRSHLLGEN
jgi:hypothetical protein